MGEDLRERLRAPFKYRCGYCGVHEDDVGGMLTVDHHRPRNRGGDESANLVYCCPLCNAYKGDYWHEVHPPHVEILHPLRDDLSNHVSEQASGELAGLTPQGTFLIRRLHLNRRQLVSHRLRDRAQRQVVAELDELRERERELRREIAELNAAYAAADAQIGEEPAKPPFG